MQDLTYKTLNLQTIFSLDHSQSPILQFHLQNPQNSFNTILQHFSHPDIDYFSDSPKQQDTSQLKEIQIRPVKQINKKSKKQGCHCKKTMCLKMYCQCFAQGNQCGPDCACIGCGNDAYNSKCNRSQPQLQTSIKQSLKPAPVQQYLKGCSCKKSHCQKRYCQCVSSNRQCNASCQCLDCHNCISYKKQQNMYNSSSIADKQDNHLFIADYSRQTHQQLEEQKQDSIRITNQLMDEIDGYIDN